MRRASAGRGDNIRGERASGRQATTPGAGYDVMVVETYTESVPWVVSGISSLKISARKIGWKPAIFRQLSAAERYRYSTVVQEYSSLIAARHDGHILGVVVGVKAKKKAVGTKFGEVT